MFFVIDFPFSANLIFRFLPCNECHNSGVSLRILTAFFFHRSGVCIRPLLPEHIETVRHYWQYAHLVVDSDSLIADGIKAGLSVGAFVTKSPTSGDLGDQEEPLPADGLVSWIVTSRDGCLGLLYTLSSQRRRGLGALLVAELTRVLEAEGYPPVLHTSESSVQHMAQQLGYEPIGRISWAVVMPPAAGGESR